MHEDSETQGSQAHFLPTFIMARVAATQRNASECTEKLRQKPRIDNVVGSADRLQPRADFFGIDIQKLASYPHWTNWTSSSRSVDSQPRRGGHGADSPKSIPYRGAVVPHRRKDHLHGVAELACRRCALDVMQFARVAPNHWNEIVG